MRYITTDYILFLVGNLVYLHNYSNLYNTTLNITYKELLTISKHIDAVTYLKNNKSCFDYMPEQLPYTHTPREHTTQDSNNVVRISNTIKQLTKQHNNNIDKTNQVKPG